MIDLSRRELLLLAGGVGTGTTVGAGRYNFTTKSNDQDSTDTEVNVESVRWDAINHEFGVFDLSEVNSSLALGQYHDNIDNFPDKKDWLSAISTHTMLNYIDVSWENIGNPDTDSEEQGAWKHTFVLTSYGINLQPFKLEKSQSLRPIVALRARTGYLERWKENF